MRLMPGRMREVELVEAADEPVDRARARAARRPARSRRARRRRPADDVARGPDLGASARPLARRVRRGRRRRRSPSPSSSSTAARTPGWPRSPPSRASCRRSTRPIGVLWRADPELAPALRSGAVVDGLLVGGTQDASRRPRDRRSRPRHGRRSRGAPRWSCPVPRSRPRRARRRSCGSRAAPCSTASRRSRPASPSSTARASRASRRRRSGCSTRPTATLLADREVDGGWGLTFVDDALVVARARRPAAPGRWEVRATDVVERRDPLDVDDAPDGHRRRRARPSGTASLQTFDDHLVLAVDTHAWVLTTAGEPVLDVALGTDSWLQPARAGVFIESTWTVVRVQRHAPARRRLPGPHRRDRRAGSRSTTARHRTSSSRSGRPPGAPTASPVARPATGERLWHVPGTDRDEPPARRDGVRRDVDRRWSPSTPPRATCAGPPRSTTCPSSCRPTAATCCCRARA